MQTEKMKEANNTYDELEQVLKGRALPSWNAIREKHGEDIEAAREEYRSLEVVKDINKVKIFVMGDLVDTFTNSREEYVEKCKSSTMVPYAVVKDGQWYQQGEMGWFGISTDVVAQKEWNNQFWEMIKALDPDTQVTLIDCHI